MVYITAAMSKMMKVLITTKANHPQVKRMMNKRMYKSGGEGVLKSVVKMRTKKKAMPLFLLGHVATASMMM